MDEATIALTVMTGLLLVSFLGFLIWGIRSGQFKNIEEAKYRIFFDDRHINNVSNGSEQQHQDNEGGEEK